jgi:hypothetical protein
MKHPLLMAAGVAAFGLFTAVSSAAAQQMAAPPAVAGAYKLAQVDSTDLPVLVKEDGSCREEITEATLTLAADNTWKFEAKVRATCGTEVTEKTETEDGKYTVSAADIDFEPDEEAEKVDVDPDKFEIDDLATGTLKDNVLTVKLDEETKVLVFRK